MTFEEQIFARHVGKGIVLDSNLLLLFLIGSFDRNRIQTFKRTERYSVSHFDLLVSLLDGFSKVLTTPHVLTEVSNLANSLPQNIRIPWTLFFRKQIPKLEEFCEPSNLICNQSGFAYFGLMDSALQELGNRALLLTDDGRLAAYLRSEEMDCLVFSELFAVKQALRARQTEEAP